MRNFHILTTLAILASLTLSACGAGQLESTPTQGLEQIQTEAVSTFSIGLTQTALSQPTATDTFTPVPTITASPTKSLPTLPSPTSAISCYKLSYVKDVTIPDNTSMTPGQSFTKTWLVANTGSCAWDAGFKFAFFGDDAMSGQTVTLSQAVNSGAEYQLTVPMIAPTDKTGTITGSWRMSDANGNFFGDVLTVVIVIGGATGTPATATAGSPEPTTTPVTPTLTPTP